MAYRNNAMVQARILEARRKKQIQLQGTARAYFCKGARAAAAEARALFEEGHSGPYELESVILHRLNVIDAGHRVLRGSDLEKSTENVFAVVQSAIGPEATVAEMAAACVRSARSAYEAWVLHRMLSGTSMDDLGPDRKVLIERAIMERFPE